MEKTGAELMLGWFEDMWTQGNGSSIPPLLDASRATLEGGASVPIGSEEAQRAQRALKEALTDIRLDFESFTSDGDQVSCAMVVNARDKISGEAVTFRSTFDGRVRDGQLVCVSNAIDALSLG
ncbi:MAG: nuclear transport factor 2 family protein [Desulfobacteraceae bacterium]|nr:nuclear transport factor 2 family protein [Desulfobacteraceae bacterium]MBC2751658.1 nuclear transport factor 2 family protein [Desulfobacteraceae bacterium]